MKTFITIFACISLILSSISDSSACTAMMVKDENGNSYVARTHEFSGVLPDVMNYVPAGSLIESQAPDGKPGMTFKTKYPFVAVSLQNMTPNAKQSAVHEGMNDQGISVSLLEFQGANGPSIDSKNSNVLSVVDLGAWILGNFQNVAQVKQSIQNKQVNIWLPQIPLIGNQPAPAHFAVFDKTGAGIVIEFTNGKVDVYDNPAGVLANGPGFPWHLENLNNYAQLSNLDRNSGNFGALKVTAPDSGNALAGLPSSQISPGRFVKAAFYSTYARKAKSPSEAILTLSHVINNFDRPYDLSIDLPSAAGGSESDHPHAVNSEVTYFTALKDLSQVQFYIRTINALNFSKIDLPRLADVKGMKKIPLAKVDALGGADATELFMK
jgi:penicillin V acylase-like amidase (Ntn superfamily)